MPKKEEHKDQAKADAEFIEKLKTLNYSKGLEDPDAPQSPTEAVIRGYV